MWIIGRAPNSIPIYSYIQQDSTSHSLFMSGNCSTCFGWYFRPSSGAHTTVSTACGICHTVTSICCHRWRAITVRCRPRVASQTSFGGGALGGAADVGPMAITGRCRQWVANQKSFGRGALGGAVGKSHVVIKPNICLLVVMLLSILPTTVGYCQLWISFLYKSFKIPFMVSLVCVRTTWILFDYREIVQDALWSPLVWTSLTCFITAGCCRSKRNVRLCKRNVCVCACVQWYSSILVQKATWI
jgi:hypothetical protein